MVPIAVPAEIVEEKQNGIWNFFKDYNIVNVPPFVCSERRKHFLWFNVSSRIAFESIGFLGPVDGDATYDVTIQVRRYQPNRLSYYSPINEESICSIRKKVEAKQRQIFHISFPNPPVIEAYATQAQEKHEFNTANGYYCIQFIIQGPNTQSVKFLNGSRYKDLRSEVNGTTIYTKHYSDQGAEIKFRKC